MSIAYDRMCCDYIAVVQNALGFYTAWCDMIMNCISSMTHSILLNDR